MTTTKITPAPLTRPLAEIARAIGTDWAAMRRDGVVTPYGVLVQHPARPYYAAMRCLHTTDLSEGFGEDVASEIVRRFLVNCAGWKGVTAREVKAELKAALLHHDIGTHQPTDLLPSTRASDDVAARRRQTMARYRSSRMGRTGTYDPLTNPRGYR